MKIYSVNECSRLLAGRMKKDYVFSHVAVRGMISSVHAHFTGVTYFTLLGEESRLFCLIGRMGGAFLTRGLESGMEATVLGDIRFNTSSGWPVLFVERVMDVQKSRDAEEKDAMMKELEEKGYFDPFRKKGLPPFPFHIGIISSESGAVVHDIVKTGRLRNPCVRYTLYSTSVQGEGAALDMAEKIREAENASDKPDVLILARGGGAEDDLRPFNERVLLEAIHACTIPLISAVGHETDTTLSDLAADRRASTPTQAAEMAIPERAAWLSLLGSAAKELEESRKSRFLSKKQEIAGILVSMKERISPERLQSLRLEIKSLMLCLDREKESCLKSRYRDVLELLVCLQRSGDMDNKSLTFEESMEILKDAARRISSKDSAIDEMAAVYKEGMEAAARCLSILNEVDGELTVISQKTEELLEKEMESHDSGSAESKTEAHQ